MVLLLFLAFWCEAEYRHRLGECAGACTLVLAPPEASGLIQNGSKARGKPPKSRVDGAVVHFGGCALGALWAGHFSSSSDSTCAALYQSAVCVHSLTHSHSITHTRPSCTVPPQLPTTSGQLHAQSMRLQQAELCFLWRLLQLPGT